MNEQKNKKYTKLGIVFNLDTHDKGGSHWVALYLDMNKQYIYYFDSCGDEVPDEVKVLMSRMKKECDSMGYRMKLMNNVGMQHQHGNTECGIYVLYFIITMLEGVHSPRFFKTHKVPDREMEMFRDIYFNKI
jgi:Ulp1 family protease